MKPSASTSTNAKSNTSSPSTSKSRSKKSSSSSSSSSSVHSSGSSTPQQSTTAQTNSNNTNRSNDNASASSSNRDKSSQKSYTGINATSVKCIWDQIDTNDVSINGDILPVIAEDASYKLWELINNVKTFSRHSGGKVTTDIVNEVLKNCSTAPIVGSSNCAWQRFECDGKFFCPTDRILDLRQEYLKSTTITQCGPITIEASWQTCPRNHKDLTKLWRSIILAIILGDDAAFQYTIHTTLINPFIGVILPELVQKTIEYLVFGCTDDTLDRLLSFLKVLVQNYHARDVSNNEEYFNLCNLFLCLLLGTIDMKAKLDFIKMERAKQKIQHEKEEREAAKAATETSIFSGIKHEQHPKPECSKDLYGSFVVNPVALNIKTETPDAPDDDQKFFDFGTTTTTKYDSSNVFGMRYEDEDDNEDIIFDINNTTQEDGGGGGGGGGGSSGSGIGIGGPHQYDDETMAGKMNGLKPSRLTRDDIYSPFITDPCDDRFVDDVCLLIGYLSGRLGYFEHEITYLLSKRLEIFFFEDRNTWTIHDFQWLRRIVQALTYLGETAFRELTLYFEHIPDDEFPEWLIPHFSFGAIYIRGRGDYYFYEYMQEVCGDVLIPFLMKYGTYMRRMHTRWMSYRRKEQLNEWSVNRKHTIRFERLERSTALTTTTTTTKTTTTTTTKTATTKTAKKPISMAEMFPLSGPPIKKANKAYVFEVGLQIFPKPQIRLTADQQFIQSFDLCNKLNKMIVRCRMLRKLVRLNKCPNPKYFIDYRMYNL